jgi:hypothetical protein
MENRVTAASLLRELDQLAWAGDNYENHEAMRKIRRAHSALADALEALHAFADPQSWDMASYQDGGTYRFIPPQESVYATPWGFAGSVLAVVTAQLQGDTKQ